MAPLLKYGSAVVSVFIIIVHAVPHVPWLVPAHKARFMSGECVVRNNNTNAEAQKMHHLPNGALCGTAKVGVAHIIFRRPLSLLC
jgi:hypothetical protein